MAQPNLRTALRARKLCTDCRWFIIDFVGGDPDCANCGHPYAFVETTNPVDGLKCIERWHARFFRSEGIIGACGPNGDLWEPDPDEVTRVGFVDDEED